MSKFCPMCGRFTANDDCGPLGVPHATAPLPSEQKMAVELNLPVELLVAERPLRIKQFDAEHKQK